MNANVGLGEREEIASLAPSDAGVRLESPHTATVIPRATYRLQLHRGFTFAQAAAVVAYLDALGVSHAYLSPYLKARPGSTHGYDIVDHNMLNPEIGDAADLGRLSATLAAHGMGQIVDVVPNHMGVHGCDNAWWLDVLEHGEASAYAGFFDIDWEPLNASLRGKVLLPVLGDHFGSVLERGELELILNAAQGTFALRYGEHCLPIDPQSYPLILAMQPEELAARDGIDHDAVRAYQTLVDAFDRLPSHRATDPERTGRRRRDQDACKGELARLCANHRAIAAYIEENVALMAGCKGEPSSFDAIAALIDRQAYRLAYWRVAADEINYRRFFDISDLAALRMEDERVFEATHRLILDLIAQGKIDGLRIDHPDGLYDPRAYFERLAAHAASALGRHGADRPIYLVIEKIVAADERFPEQWPVHGSTGYRFANLLTGLFIDNAAKSRLDRIYRGWVGDAVPFAETVYRAKHTIMRSALAAELNVLAWALSRIAQSDRRTCDFTVHALSDALAEVVACFPVYRTYVSSRGASAQDRHFIEWAVGLARKRTLAADVSIYDFIFGILTTAICDGRPPAYCKAVLAFTMKFQQFTGPVMAKGFEDTSLYRYHRLIALNDVGGDPECFGFSVKAFHAATQDRIRNWPHTMLATSTHDSKRAEDVRSRIAVISEAPAAWRLALSRWRRMNRSKRVMVDGQLAPSPNDEYLLYQTLVGAWPLTEMDTAALEEFRQRIERYMQKANREAKLATSWLNPNERYERAVAAFVGAILAPGSRSVFLRDIQAFVRRIARFGLINSLAQTVIKIASPGVPDFYQGSELWDFSLVDPDNRRPVDFIRRRAMLDALIVQARSEGGVSATMARGLADTLEDRRAKLFLTWRGLALRRSLEPVFAGGDYLPLTPVGAKASHVIAFARRARDRIVIAIAPRLCYGLVDGADVLPIGETVWGDTHIQLPSEWTAMGWSNHLTNEPVASAAGADGPVLTVASVMSNFPVALLVGVQPSAA